MSPQAILFTLSVERHTQIQTIKENHSLNTRYVRSKADVFNFQEHCLLCDDAAGYSDRNVALV